MPGSPLRRDLESEWPVLSTGPQAMACSQNKAISSDALMLLLCQNTLMNQAVCAKMPGLFPCSWAYATPFLSPRGRGGDSVVGITWQLRGKDTERSMLFSSSFGCIKMLLASKWPHGFAPSSPRMQPVCFWLLGLESWVSNISCVGRGCYWILWVLWKNSAV